MSAETSVPALALHAVSKRLGGRAIINGVSLAVQAGERVALIGPNGAGKSTLFDLISGRLRPDSGQICLGGQRIDGKKTFEIQRLGLSRSFQITQIFGGLSVLDNLRCAALPACEPNGRGLALRHFFKPLARLPEVNRRAEHLLEITRLQARRHQRADQLAYAEQRALELGITLAAHPRVILLDEPTAGMSADETAYFIELIAQASAGCALLMVEHDMAAVFRLARRIAVLDQGRLLAEGSPQAVRANPAVQAVYLGLEEG